MVFYHNLPAKCLTLFLRTTNIVFTVSINQLLANIKLKEFIMTRLNRLNRVSKVAGVLLISSFASTVSTHEFL